MLTRFLSNPFNIWTSLIVFTTTLVLSLFMAFELGESVMFVSLLFVQNLLLWVVAVGRGITIGTLQSEKIGEILKDITKDTLKD